MTIKLIVLCGLFAVALGFAVPQDQYINRDVFYEPTFVDENQFEDNGVLMRIARSPQNSVGVNAGHSSRDGTSAGVEYNRQLSRNLEAYASAQRNFKLNDNSAHAGLRYRF